MKAQLCGVLATLGLIGPASAQFISYPPPDTPARIEIPGQRQPDTMDECGNRVTNCKYTAALCVLVTIGKFRLPEDTGPGSILEVRDGKEVVIEHFQTASIVEDRARGVVQITSKNKQCR